MSTTAVAVELVITGIQALVWIFLLTASAISTPQVVALIRSVDQAQGWMAGILFVIGAFAYSLGIVLDKLYDMIFENFFERRIWKEPQRKNTPYSEDAEVAGACVPSRAGHFCASLFQQIYRRLPFQQAAKVDPHKRSDLNPRFEILVLSGRAPQLLDYLKTRVRLSRSTCCNFVLTAAALAAPASRATLGTSAALSLSALCLLVAASSFFAWVQLFRRDREVVRFLYDNKDTLFRFPPEQTSARSAEV